MRRLLAVLFAFVAALLTTSSALAQNEAYNCTNYDTLTKGQQKIDQGQYEEAIRVFSCVMQANPQTVDAYRGRSEAKLLLNRYSDAYHDIYALLISTVQPEDILALGDSIIASYDARLAASPWNVPALTGGSFARWAYYQYDTAIPMFNKLLTINSWNVYAKLFRGSSRMFAGIDVCAGEGDLSSAIWMSPWNPHVRYIVADAYTYAQPDLDEAYDQASLALSWGLDTPRIHAILAAALAESGDTSGTAAQIQAHINGSTTANVNTSALAAGTTKYLEVAPGKAYQIPVTVTAGQTLNITTSSSSDNLWDTILVLVDSNGNPVIGNDDFVDYFAGLSWVAPSSGTYTLRVTSFEASTYGLLEVTRD